METRRTQPPPEPPPSGGLPRGTLIDRYVVLETIGRGGMGMVYVAYDPKLERRVAIKVLHADLAFDETRARLLREAQAMARLTHPNVVAVHDVGTFGECVFIAMDYVAGQTLNRWLQQERRSWRETLTVLCAAGQGLAAAHAAGIVHRDFKPDNVLIADDGRVVVTDFGIARADAPANAVTGAIAPRDLPPKPGASKPPDSGPYQDDPLTEEGSVLGTVGYMSPEQAWGEPTDARTDQFSFCATLYYALYGVLPFPARTMARYLRALDKAIAEPPAASRVPPWVRRVLLRGLGAPDDRYPTMEALLRELAHDPGVVRRRWTAAAAGLLVASAAVFVLARRESAAREECREGERLIASTWDDGRKDDVRRALAATDARDAGDTADRVVHALDEYASRWSAAHRESCEATRVRRSAGEEAMYLRLACLERRRTELEALARLFARADTQIAGRALEATFALVPPSACADPAAHKAIVALPMDATARAQVVEARRALADADSLAAAGKHKESLARADQALVGARAAGHRATEAEALLHIGQVQELTGAYSDAVGPYGQTIAAAEAAADDATLALAAARLAFIVGDKLLKPDEADGWLAIARGALERLGPNESVEARILLAQAPLPTAAGHPELSIPLYDRLIPIAERVYGPDHPITLRALNNFGNTLQLLGRHEIALATHRRAVESVERTVGRDAASLTTDYSNIGSSLIGLGRYPEADVALNRAVTLAEMADPQSFWVGWALQFIGVSALRVGDTARALAAARLGLEIAERRGAPAAKLLPGLLSVEGRASTARGDPAAGEVACRRVVEEQERRGAIGPDKVYTWDALTCLGEALVALGRADEALVPLERSVALPRRVYAGDLAMARFALARALVATKREPSRVRPLVLQAEAELLPLDARAAEREEVLRWLLANPAPR